MKNWKTTLFGIIAAIALNGSLFGIPPKIAQPIAIIAGTVFAASAKDRNVTGGSTLQQTPPQVIAEKIEEAESVLRP